MDFQKFVDGFHPMTCVMSVENLGDGKWGEIRIVCGNKAYIDSIENMPDMPEAFSNKFIPNSLYQDYFPQDPNFELFLYGSAVQKKPMHSYVHPERFDFWFNLFSMPLDADDGKLCYCTYTQELTHDIESEKMSNISHDTATEVLNTCIKLRGSTNFKETLYEVIKDIRNICGAEFCGLLGMNEITQECTLLGEDLSDTFRDTKYKKDWFSPAFYQVAKTWEKVLDGSNCIIYRNPEEREAIKNKSQVWYESLKDANVESLVLFPLKVGYELIGYIWANNFDTEKTLHIKETLEITTFFLASEISSYQMFDRFRILSTVDLLTGVLNRNEMNNRVMQLGIDDRPGRKNLGIVFADLNGLKRMNDNNGHSAGDKLIKDAATILKSVFTEGEIYRAGGDEFMVLLRGTSSEELKQYEKQLKEKAAATDNVSFAVGLCLEADSQKIYEAMKIADVNMYDDKQKYYDAHPEINRR